MPIGDGRVLRYTAAANVGQQVIDYIPIGIYRGLQHRATSVVKVVVNPVS